MMIEVAFPARNEGEVLPEFLRRTDAALAPLKRQGWDFFLTMIDDGSSDGSAELVKGFSGVFKAVRVLRIPPSGYAAAVAYALAHASRDADALVLLDSDLQDPPETLPLLLENWRKSRCLTLASRAARSELAWPQRACTWLFHSVMGLMGGLGRDVGIYGVYPAVFVREVQSEAAQKIYLPERVARERKIDFIPVVRGARGAGTTRAGWGGWLALASTAARQWLSHRLHASASYLWQRKLWWMLPLVFVLVSFALLVYLTEGSVTLPFAYTLF